MIIRYLSHKLTVYRSHISWEKNTQFHMTCHIYQHMWLVIHVSFPEHCWRVFCWLPKGYDCGGMNPCCVVFTPNQLNIITFHFSGLNLLYLACITNDRKAQANRDILFSTFWHMNHENERSKLLFWWNCHDCEVVCSKCGWTLFVFMTSLDVGVFCLSVLLLKRHELICSKMQL